MLHGASESAALPVLDSNGFRLDNSRQRLGWLTPSNPDEPLAALRRRYDADGYLWLKGLLPAGEVWDFRRYFFSQFLDTGLIAAGSDPRVGLSSGDSENSDLARRRLMEMVRSAAFEAFCLHPRLWRFLDGFLGGIAYLHKRKLIRYTKPGDASATGAHYDLTYLRAGTDRIVTAWIPIGDTPHPMGGLVYLEGSDAPGRAMEAEFGIANADLPPEQRISGFNKTLNDGGWISKNLPDMADRFDSRWLIADYQAGDVVLHSPYMIHASTANEDQAGRLRLSTDIRYQNVGDAIDARWSNHWTLGDML